MSTPSVIDEALLESLGIAQFLPPAVARWTPLVLEGLSFFLSQLSEKRQHEIMLGQMLLPADAPAERRLVSLLGQCPTLHKLGQVVARHRELPAELKSQLQTLESLAPSADADEVRAAVLAELPDGAPISLASEPLAEGSVAVVLPFTFEEEGEFRHGVFKVVKPGVEERLIDELAIWSNLVRFLDRRSREMGLAEVDFVSVLDSVKDLVALELRLDVEQANMAAAADFYANDSRILVPRLLDWSTPRMTAMERVFGCKITDSPLSAKERSGLADAAVSALVAQPFWSAAPVAVVHADPHAGNLLATEDGRLAVIDWSLTARLDKAQREAVVDAALAGMTLNKARLTDAIAELTRLDEEDPRLIEAVENALRRVRHFRFGGLDWLIELLDELFSGAGSDTRDELVLFRKAWLTLSGVAGDLAGDHAADPVLAGEGLKRFLAEFPKRMVTPFRSRDFATHLSNADLMRLWISFYALPARFWLGVGKDMGRWTARNVRSAATTSQESSALKSALERITRRLYSEAEVAG